MRSLTDVYNKVASQDAELEKQAAVLIKQAEEEDAAGRIMARGFADELNKIAQPFDLGKLNTGDNYKLRDKGPGGANQQQQRRQTSQAVAGQAGGGSARPIGAPPMGRQSSKQPNAAAPKPMGGGVAAPKPAAPKPAGPRVATAPKPGM